MKITRIYVDGFGILNNLDIKVPEEGIALFYGPNESGKTTLGEFIKFILGGPKRKAKLKELSYQPSNSSKFGGYLEIVTSCGREYIIERYITATSKAEGQVVVRDKGSFIDDKGLKDVIGDISLKFYTSIFAFGLSDLLEISSLDQEEIKTRVLSSGEGIKAETLNAAYSELRNQMDELYKPSGIKPEINRLLTKLDLLEKEILELKVGEKMDEETKMELEKLKKTLKYKYQSFSEIEKSAKWLTELSEKTFEKLIQVSSQKVFEAKNIFFISSLFVCTILASVLAFSKNINFRFGIGVSILFLASALMGAFKGAKRRKKSTEESKKYLIGATSFASSVDQSIFRENRTRNLEDLDYIKNVKDKLVNEKSLLEKEIRQLEREIDIREIEFESSNRENEIMALIQEFESAKALLKEKLEDWATFSICLTFLRKLHETQNSRTTPELMNEASRCLNRMTNFKYDKILVSEEGNFSESLIVDKRGKRCDSNKLSSGTKEQLYLALRLAIIEQYNRKFEPLPVLMDDVLVNYDSIRTNMAVNLISEMAQKNQIFVFTCHDLIAKHFREIGQLAVDFNMSL